QCVWLDDGTAIDQSSASVSYANHYGRCQPNDYACIINGCHCSNGWSTGSWFNCLSSRDTSANRSRSEEHTSELQSRFDLVCRLLLEKKNIMKMHQRHADSFGQLMQVRVLLEPCMNHGDA